MTKIVTSPLNHLNHLFSIPKKKFFLNEINLILVFVIRFITINKSLYLINEVEISLWARSRRV
jgi:hypothetical protein